MSTETVHSPTPPFDELPVIEAPTEAERRSAKIVLGPDVVPDEGPVPDVDQGRTLEESVTVPEWLAVAVATELVEADQDPDAVDDPTIEHDLLNRMRWEFDFRLDDGRPFAAVVRELAGEWTDEHRKP